jgi:hypothetical protein
MCISSAPMITQTAPHLAAAHVIERLLPPTQTCKARVRLDNITFVLLSFSAVIGTTNRYRQHFGPVRIVFPVLLSRLPCRVRDGVSVPVIRTGIETRTDL